MMYNNKINKYLSIKNNINIKIDLAVLRYWRKLANS